MAIKRPQYINPIKKPSLTFRLNKGVQIEPDLSTLSKNSDGTWNVKLRLNGTLNVNSIESLEVSEEDIHQMILTREVEINIMPF